MLVGALAGVPLGTMILARVDPLAVRWAIIVVVISLLVLLMSGWRYHGKPTTPLTVGVGAIAGVFGGAAQVSGPPVVAYWLGGALPAATVRANLVFYFAMSSLITGVNYTFAGFFDLPAFTLSLVTGPVFGLGVLAGSRLFGKGEGRILNYPFPAGSGKAQIVGAFQTALIAAAKTFKPDLVMVSAGFDSRMGDPLGRFALTDEDFREMTTILLDIANQHAHGRLVSVLEGGYSLSGLAAGVTAHVETLMR